MSSKRKIQLAIPAFLMAMIGDYLMGIDSIGTTSGGDISWNTVPDIRIAVSAVLGALCTVLFTIAALEAIKVLEARNGGSKWVKLFKISNYAGITSFMFIHIAICMLILIFNASFDATGDTNTAIGIMMRVLYGIALPLAVTFAVADIGAAVAWFGLILKKEIDAPKFTVIFNPIVIALLGQLVNLIPLPFFGLDSGFESLGWLLMYAVIAKYADKGEKIKDM